jgi:hypothetical protein
MRTGNWSKTQENRVEEWGERLARTVGTRERDPTWQGGAGRRVPTKSL